MNSSQNPITSADVVHELLLALDQQLGAAGTSFDLVVIGGSALLAKGLVGRAT